MPIHPTAVVDNTAELDTSVEVGPYAVVEGNVKIGAGTRLYPHAYVSWGTTLGERVEIHPFAVVGHLPQDWAFKGEPSYTAVGDETVIREHASVHRGTIPESTTVVGKHCMIMATGHVAHNCIVGDNVVIVNSAMLAGHVHVGDRAFFGGGAGVHQFCRIGELVMLRGNSSISKDVPPFMMTGPRGVVGVNVVGMRRAGLDAAERQEIRRCYRVLYRSGMHFPRAIEEVASMIETDAGRRLVEFLQADSRRGYQRYLGRDSGDSEVSE